MNWKWPYLHAHHRRSSSFTASHWHANGTGQVPKWTFLLHARLPLQTEPTVLQCSEGALQRAVNMPIEPISFPIDRLLLLLLLVDFQCLEGTTRFDSGSIPIERLPLQIMVLDH